MAGNVHVHMSSRLWWFGWYFDRFTKTKHWERGKKESRNESIWMFFKNYILKLLPITDIFPQYHMYDMFISLKSSDISTISPLIIRLSWAKVSCWNFISFPMAFKDQEHFQILPKDSILTFMPHKAAGLLSTCGW